MRSASAGSAAGMVCSKGCRWAQNASDDPPKCFSTYDCVGVSMKMSTQAGAKRVSTVSISASMPAGVVPSRPEQEVAGHVRDADGVQIDEGALDGLDALATAVVTGVDLGVEGLDAEGELVEAVGGEHVQALAAHHRRIELHLARRLRMPRDRRVERLEQLAQQRGRQDRRRPATHVEGMERQRAQDRTDHAERPQRPRQPRLQQLGRRRPQAVVVAEVTDRFAERHVDVDAVERLARSGGGALDAARPQRRDFLFRPHRGRAVQIGEA